MTRCIPVANCMQCPYRDHKGAFAKVSNVPVCRKADKELPYTVAVTRHNTMVASLAMGIPDWCPLPEFKQ